MERKYPQRKAPSFLAGKYHLAAANATCRDTTEIGRSGHICPVPALACYGGVKAARRKSAMPQNILVETKGRVGIIRFNRSQALNALNAALVEELNAAIDAF